MEIELVDAKYNFRNYLRISRCYYSPFLSAPFCLTFSRSWRLLFASTGLAQWQAERVLIWESPALQKHEITSSDEIPVGKYRVINQGNPFPFYHSFPFQ